VGKGVISPGVKQRGSEADHSPASDAEVKNDGAILLFPIRLHVLVPNYVIKYMEKFTFHFTFKQMLRWFHVAVACFSCNPLDINQSELNPSSVKVTKLSFQMMQNSTAFAPSQ
jgi:hypothetical protein